MKTKIVTLLLLGASALAAAPRVSFGIGFGVGPRYYAPAPVYVAPYAAPAPVYPAPAYVAPPAPYYAVPPSPGYGYSWVGGYWSGVGPHRAWHAGNWAGPRGGFRRR